MRFFYVKNVFNMTAYMRILPSDHPSLLRLLPFLAASHVLEAEHFRGPDPPIMNEANERACKEKRQGLQG